MFSFIDKTLSQARNIEMIEDALDKRSVDDILNNYIDDIIYDIETDKVYLIYKSGEKISYDVNSLNLVSSDERELGVERDYLIEPNIHVVFYPEGFLSTYYFDA